MSCFSENIKKKLAFGMFYINHHDQTPIWDNTRKICSNLKAILWNVLIEQNLIIVVVLEQHLTCMCNIHLRSYILHSTTEISSISIFTVHTEISSISSFTVHTRTQQYQNVRYTSHKTTLHSEANSVNKESKLF